MKKIKSITPLIGLVGCLFFASPTNAQRGTHPWKTPPAAVAFALSGVWGTGFDGLEASFWDLRSGSRFSVGAGPAVIRADAFVGLGGARLVRREDPRSPSWGGGIAGEFISRRQSSGPSNAVMALGLGGWFNSGPGRGSLHGAVNVCGYRDPAAAVTGFGWAATIQGGWQPFKTLPLLRMVASFKMRTYDPNPGEALSLTIGGELLLGGSRRGR